MQLQSAVAAFRHLSKIERKAETDIFDHACCAYSVSAKSMMLSVITVIASAVVLLMSMFQLVLPVLIVLLILLVSAGVSLDVLYVIPK